MSTAGAETVIDPREVVWSLRYVIRSLICESFRSHNLKFKPEQAMTVSFRLRDKSEVQLLLWAPMNYVGVFTRSREHIEWTPWEAKTYHDSCWTDGVEKFVNEHAEQTTMMGLDGLRVIKLSGDECQSLRQALRTRGL